MLAEPRRQQLDGIVQRMIDNKESDEDIQFVVGDFTSKYEQEGIKPTGLETGKIGAVAEFTGGKELAVGAAKVLGGEAGQLERSAEQLAQDANALISKAKSFPTGDPRRKQLLTQARDMSVQLSNQASQFSSELPTSKQVIGSAAKLGLTAGTLGAGLGAGSLGAQALKGAGLGAGFGASQALEEGKTGKELIAPTIAGGAIGGSIPIIAEGIKRGFTKFFPQISRALERSNLRLTPTQKVNLKNKLGDVEEFMSKNKIVGTPEHRFEVVNEIYETTERKLQNFLETNNTAKGIFVSKQGLLSQLESLKKNLMRDNSDAPIIARQIDSAIDNIRTQYTFEKIPISRLNELKRTTYSNAYTKAGDKVLDTVEHDIGDVLKKGIEQATNKLKVGSKSIAAFNKAYGTVINARKLLKVAQGKNQLGIFGRLISGLVGGSVGATVGGGPLGTAVGFGLTEEGAKILATPARSAISAGLRTISEKAQTPLAKGVGEVAKRLTLPTIFRK